MITIKGKNSKKKFAVKGIQINLLDELTDLAITANLSHSTFFNQGVVQRYVTILKKYGFDAKSERDI